MRRKAKPIPAKSVRRAHVAAAVAEATGRPAEDIIRERWPNDPTFRDMQPAPKTRFYETR